MSFTKNFALTGNVADVVAKDDSQMGVANLCGLGLGVSFISYFHTPLALIGLFCCAAPIHYFATLKLLQAAEFKVLNGPALIILCRSYIDSGNIPTQSKVLSKLKWFGEYHRDPTSRLKIGSTIRQEFFNSKDLVDALETYANEQYLLRQEGTGVVLKKNAENEDVIKSVLNAVKVQSCLDVAEALKWTNENFELFKEKLEEDEWQTDSVFFGDSGHRFESP